MVYNGGRRLIVVDGEGKVIVHKSFPYAPCINNSQPLDFLHTLTI